MWLLVGFITTIIVHLHNMRGKEFDKDYFFDIDKITISVLLTVFGYLSPIILILIWVMKKNYL